jgi:hypothetical protein
LGVVLPSETLLDSPLASEMVRLGNWADALGCEDSWDGTGPKKIEGDNPEEPAEVFKSQSSGFQTLLFEVRKLLSEGDRSIVLEQSLSVHVLPASPVVQESNDVIEHCPHFFSSRSLLLKLPDGPGDQLLGLLRGVEEGQILVDQIRFAVFLGAFNFLL